MARRPRCGLCRPLYRLAPFHQVSLTQQLTLPWALRVMTHSLRENARSSYPQKVPRRNRRIFLFLKLMFLRSLPLGPPLLRPHPHYLHAEYRRLLSSEFFQLHYMYTNSTLYLYVYSSLFISQVRIAWHVLLLKVIMATGVSIVMVCGSDHSIKTALVAMSTVIYNQHK